MFNAEFDHYRSMSIADKKVVYLFTLLNYKKLRESKGAMVKTISVKVETEAQGLRTSMMEFEKKVKRLELVVGTRSLLG